MVESAVGCYIKGSAYNAQSILNNTWTQVTSPLDTVIWNSGGWSASAKQFVAPVAGKYQLFVAMWMSPGGNSANRQGVGIYRNGLGNNLAYVTVPSNSNVNGFTSCVASLNAGDIITVWCIQDTGLTQTIQWPNTYFGCFCLGA